MATSKKTPVTDATVTIYKKSDDSLVKTCSLQDIYYIANDLPIGDYYYKILATDKGIVIEDLIITEDTINPIEKTIILFPAINDIRVSLADKDGVNIDDATIKISNIEASYVSIDTNYKVDNIPKTVNNIQRELYIEHTTSTYQTISKDVVIEDGATFSEVLYPVIDIFMKAYIIVDGTTIDITNKTNCVLYDLTGDKQVDSSSRVGKSSGYFTMNDKNDGTYNFYIPSFNTIIDGQSYTVEGFKQDIYLDYESSTLGQIYVDLTLNIEN